MATERSYGVIAIHGGRVLLLKHGQGHWGLPKGHAEEGETSVDAAKRELAEEAGITDVKIHKTPAFGEQYTYKRDGLLINKQVTYFIGTVGSEDVKTQKDEILDYQWLDIDQAIEKATFKETGSILSKAKAYMAQQTPS